MKQSPTANGGVLVKDYDLAYEPPLICTFKITPINMSFRWSRKLINLIKQKNNPANSIFRSVRKAGVIMSPEK